MEMTATFAPAPAAIAALARPPVRPTFDPDASLIERARAGDEAAYRALFERHSPRIQRVVSRYMKDRDDAADVVQEVFARAFRALRNFNGHSLFSTWLHRIAVNQAIHRLRAMKAERQVIERLGGDEDAVDERQAASQPAAETPESVLASKQVAAMIERAVAALSSDHRTALELREVDGLSYASIAAQLGIPTGTVRTRIFRGREAVAAALAPVRTSRSRRRF